MKVAICVPTAGHPRPAFLRSVVGLIHRCAVAGPEITWQDVEMTEVPAARHGLAMQALADPAHTHLLWLDDDMVFPPDALSRLLVHGLPIVGTNYRRRRPPYLGVASCFADQPIDSAGRSGLEAVRATGFGCVLVAREVFALVPKPWFQTPWDEQGFWTEDVFFCDQARAAGFKVVIDHDLSNDLVHLGVGGWRFGGPHE